ncbi:MAG: DUF2330 domain-containing protein, partial [Deltaproteobacteria bacterium]|nr:DUF2330 domain-containing protein [Deltaproteobacteria bacterium]
MHHFFQRATASAAVLSTYLALFSPDAWACGACFGPPAPPVPGDPTFKPTVVQDAERVLFVRDEATKTSHVWVEVRYTGDAKDFGWVLPVPKLPKISVGTVLLFDRLDAEMHARYFLLDKGNENCSNPSIGCEPKAY